MRMDYSNTRALIATVPSLAMYQSNYQIRISLYTSQINHKQNSKYQ
jgi:hypothetical protein